MVAKSAICEVVIYNEDNEKSISVAATVCGEIMVTRHCGDGVAVEMSFDHDEIMPVIRALKTLLSEHAGTHD